MSVVWTRWRPAQATDLLGPCVTGALLARLKMRPRWYWVDHFEMDCWITPRAIFWPVWFVWRTLRVERLVFGACRLLRRLGVAEKPEGERWTVQGAWKWPL